MVHLNRNFSQTDICKYYFSTAYAIYILLLFRNYSICFSTNSFSILLIDSFSSDKTMNWNLHFNLFQILYNDVKVKTFSLNRINVILNHMLMNSLRKTKKWKKNKKTKNIIQQTDQKIKEINLLTLNIHSFLFSLFDIFTPFET